MPNSRKKTITHSFKYTFIPSFSLSLSLTHTHTHPYTHIAYFMQTVFTSNDCVLQQIYTHTYTHTHAFSRFKGYPNFQIIVTSYSFYISFNFCKSCIQNTRHHCNFLFDLSVCVNDLLLKTFTCSVSLLVYAPLPVLSLIIFPLISSCCVF